MSKNPKDEKNVFFDINKLPPEKGLLLFGLSMNKLEHGRQTAKDCLEDIRNFSPSKVSKPLIGLNFIYSDFLYLYSNKPAPELKQTFMNQIIVHKNSFQKLIAKNYLEFQIQHAFSYMVWNQLYVGTDNFNELFIKIKEIYAGDSLFQKHLKEDCEIYGKEMGDNQTHYFLEEILMFYLLTHNKIKLPNEYIEGQQKWVLFCYPGRPLKSTVYFYQLDPFKFTCPENPYARAHYDLESKQLIEFDRVDLETYKVR
jgi:hypothetical protein